MGRTQQTAARKHYGLRTPPHPPDARRVWKGRRGRWNMKVAAPLFSLRQLDRALYSAADGGLIYSLQSTVWLISIAYSKAHVPSEACRLLS